MAKSAYTLIISFIVSGIIASSAWGAKPPAKKESLLDTSGFTLTPTLSGYKFAGADHLNPAMLYGVKFGYDTQGKSIADSVGIEGTLNYFTTKSKTDDSSVNGYLVRLDAVYPFTPRKKLVPFLAVGAGGIITSSSTNTDTNPFLNYGLGLKYFFENYLALRVDARHLLVYNNINTHNNLELSVGLTYVFGKERTKKPVPVPDTKQKEKVQKEKELKAKITAATTAVEAKSAAKVEAPSVSPFAVLAAPFAVLAAPTAVLKFTSADTAAPTSVFAATPKPAAPEKGPVAKGPAVAGEKATAVATEIINIGSNIQVTGNPPASGGSAVTLTPGKKPIVTGGQAPTAPAPALPTDMEKARETAAAGAQPPAKAAEVVRPTVAMKLTVEFDSGSSYIKPKYLRPFQQISEFMTTATDSVARIEGLSDSTGTMDDKLRISRQRAESVKSTLVGFGVGSDRITAIGSGSAELKTENLPTAEEKRKLLAPTVVTVFARSAEKGVTPPSTGTEELTGESVISPAAMPGTATAIPAPAKIKGAPAAAAQAKGKAAVPAAPVPPLSQPAPAVGKSPAKAELQGGAPAPAPAAPQTKLGTAPAPAKPVVPARPEAAVVKETKAEPTAPVPALPPIESAVSANARAPVQVPAPAGKEVPPVQAEKAAPVAKIPVAARPVAQAPAPAIPEQPAKAQEEETAVTKTPAVVPAPSVPKAAQAQAKGAPAAAARAEGDVAVPAAPMPPLPQPAPALVETPAKADQKTGAPVSAPAATQAKVQTAPEMKPAVEAPETGRGTSGLHTKVISLEGNVRVTGNIPAPDKSAVILTPGTMVAVKSGQAPPSPVPAPPAELHKAREEWVVETQPPASPKGEVRKPIGRKVIMRLTVEFDFDRSHVKPRYNRQLKKMAEFINASPGSSARIEGHSDIIGKQYYNFRLSKKRAENVKRSLMTFGVNPSRITTRGYGPTRPIADNSTKEGRQKNRRAVTSVSVEIYAPATPPVIPSTR